MTLDEIIACATPEERLFLKENASPFAEFHNDDGARGVQARMTGLVEALQLCLLHESRRARARGIDGNVLYNGLASVFATLIANVVDNLEETDHEKAIFDFSALAAGRAVQVLNGDVHTHLCTYSAPEGVA